MGAPECGGRDMPQAASTTPTGAQSGLGGSPLRAAGGQPYRRFRPQQAGDLRYGPTKTCLLQSIQKTNPNPARGLGFGIWEPRPKPGNPSTLGRFPALSSLRYL